MLTLSVPLWTPMNEELGFTYAQLNDSYGASAVALCFGCILFVPFALRYGRRPVYLASTTMMLVTAIWSARIETLGDLMGSNVLMGLSGAVNETLFQMTVSDLFFVHQRGTLNGLLLVFGTIGNYFGPVASGYCATTMGWRWPYWFSTIFLGVTIVLLALFLEESKYVPAPTEGIVVPTHGGDAFAGRVEEEKNFYGEKQDPAISAPGARRDSANEIIGYSASENFQQRIVSVDDTIPIRPLRQRYALYTPSPPSSYTWPRHLYQPFLLIYHFPAVAFTSIIWAFCLSALSVVAVSQSDLLPLPPYNFSSAGVGLTNVPAAIGNILGTLWGGPVVDWYIVRSARKNGGIYEPEMRIHLFVLPAVVMVVGVFVFGLTIAEVCLQRSGV
jgi:MFS family permease